MRRTCPDPLRHGVLIDSSPGLGHHRSLRLMRVMPRYFLALVAIRVAADTIAMTAHIGYSHHAKVRSGRR